MRLFTSLGMAALACLLAAGCGESPTAPSPTAATDPAASVFTTAPYPAPVSQTLTGTWFLGDRRFMTLTQNGDSVTGMPSPVTVDAGGGVSVTESGLISGVVDGERVMLTLTERISMSGFGVICTAGHTFSGVLAGNTLSGTITQTAPRTCGAGVNPPDLEPIPGGPVTYTRQ